MRIESIRRLTLRMKRGFLSIVAIASVVFAAAGLARATTVSSGWIQWVPNVPVVGGTTLVWLYAELFTGQDYDGTIRPFNKGCLQVQWNLPASHLGVTVRGWRNGGFCGSRELFNTSSAMQFCVQSKLCTNPSGLQSFQTDMSTKTWNGSSYQLHGWQVSPGFNQ